MPQTWEGMTDEEEEDLPTFTWDEEEEDVPTFTSILFQGVAFVFFIVLGICGTFIHLCTRLRWFHFQRRFDNVAT